jgi:xylose isomerase
VDLAAAVSISMQNAEGIQLILQDLFYAHVGGMDVFARALIVADNVLQKSDYKKIRKDRYASFDSGTGKEFEEGKLTLEAFRDFAAANGEPAVASGKQEYLENLINRFI